MFKNTHRPAHEWLDDLSKARSQKAGLKPRVTLPDLQERINDPNAEEQALIPSSPRSVEACFQCGLDPVELQYHPISFYHIQGESEELSKLRYEKFEVVRQERMQLLIEKRKEIIDSGWTPETAPKKDKKKGDDEGESAMVEAERAKLEAFQRRQEKEIQQMIQFELQRKELADKQQKKIQEMEKRALTLQQHKIESEIAWQAKQRDIELQKKREEQEAEVQKRRAMDAATKRDRERAAAAAEEEKWRKQESYRKEMERRKKLEEQRKEAEMAALRQAEAIEARRIAMEQKDLERKKRLEKEAKEAAKLNAEKRKKAEERIASALSQSQSIMETKRREQAKREEEVEVRRRQHEEQKRKQEEAKKKEEERKEAERISKLQQAAEIEEKRKCTWRQKAEEKDTLVAEMYLQRKRDADIKRLNSEFEMKLRLDKVDAIQKTHLYQRQQLYNKIMEEYETARKLMHDRAKLQEKRKLANMQSAMQRQSLSRAMGSIRGNDINRLASGSMSVAELLRRPNTAAM